jgi:DNA-directed RNA polymerase subunit RPC12/RpoP
MATKAELEFENQQHRSFMDDARAKLEAGAFSDAVEAALMACQYVDGMMQYDRRWGSKSDFQRIDSIALVLRYAPLIFDSGTLEQLATLLKLQRRIDKNAAADIAADLDAAKETMWDAYRLWTHLEIEIDVRQDELRGTFGGDQDRWRWIAEMWERMGILKRVSENGSYRLSLATRLDIATRGKCESCGATGQAAKYQLLQEIRCPKCQHLGFFVLLVT